MTQDERPVQPLVTVVTLCYNLGAFVLHTLQSVKNQTYGNIQHIIIDDCSTDGSAKLIAGWIKRNNYACEFYVNEENLKITRSHSKGLRLAKGDYLTFCNDDVMLPDRVSHAVSELEQHPEYCMLYSDAALINEKYEITAPSFISKLGLEPKSGHVFSEYFDKKLPAYAPTFFFRTQILRDIGGYDERIRTEDRDSMLRITRHHKILYSRHNDIQYLQRTNSFSNSPFVDAAKERLITLDKFKDDELVKKRVIQSAKKYVVSCYAKNDREYSIRWVHYLLNQSFHPVLYLYAVLMRINTPGIILRMLHLFFKRTGLLRTA